LCLAVAAALLGAGCSNDDSGDSAARNSSNFNTRSIVAFGNEVPIIDGARDITRGAIEGGAWHRTYDVTVPPADVLAFYQRELPSAGWTDSTTPSTTPGGVEATWHRRGLRLDVTVAPSSTGSGAATTVAASTSTVNLALTRTGS
jgi:hypothetical protein